jgi:hypothetical protein
LKRRTFLAGLVAGIAGLLVPDAPAILVPERRYWALDRTMATLPAVEDPLDEDDWLVDDAGQWQEVSLSQLTTQRVEEFIVMPSLVGIQTVISDRVVARINKRAFAGVGR